MDQKTLTTTIWDALREHDVPNAQAIAQTLGFRLLPGVQAAQAEHEARGSEGLIKAVDATAVEAWFKGQLSAFHELCITNKITDNQKLELECITAGHKIKIKWTLGHTYDALNRAAGIEFDSVFAEACRRQKFNLNQQRLADTPF